MATNIEKAETVHTTKKSGKKPRSPSVGAILRLKLRCFQTDVKIFVAPVKHKQQRNVW